MAHAIQNARRLLTDRRMLPAYLGWCASRTLGQPPALGLPFGGRLGEFQDFSEYWTNLDLYPTRAEQRLLRDHLRPGGVALDVGANLGVFSVMLGRLQPSATVYGFEPAGQTFARLMQNLRRNALANVEPLHMAVGKESGAVALAVNGKSSAISRIQANGQGAADGWAVEEVPCTTIDDFCADRGIAAIDFAKVDVEGAEPQVLAGAAAMLRRRAIGCLLIEICPGNLSALGSCPRELFDLARMFDYRFYAVADGPGAGLELSARDLEAMELENVALRPA